MRTALVWTANIIGWPVIQLGISRWMLSRPSAEFARDDWITRERRWEEGGLLYRRHLSLNSWKRMLPDGAAWLGGIPKKSLVKKTADQYSMHMQESRRAELAHWYMILCTPVFFLWNPWWASLVMVAYGISANLPCILVQRFNRARFRRCLLTAWNLESPNFV